MSRNVYSGDSEDDGEVSPYGSWEKRQATSRADPGFPAGRPLPSKTIARGTPVWEPPEIDCEDLMGEEYEKMRKTILEFSGNNVATTTEYLDWYIQHVLDWRYASWAREMFEESEKCTDADSAYFYHGLMTELEHDAQLFYDEGSERAGIALYQVREDENYHVACYNPFAAMWDGHPRIIQISKEYKERVKPRVETFNSTHEAKKVAGADRLEREKASDRLSIHSVDLEEGDCAAPANAQGRLLAQEDDAEEEEMEWLPSLEPTCQQPANIRPLILQLVHFTARKQDNSGMQTHGSNDVD